MWGFSRAGSQKKSPRYPSGEGSMYFSIMPWSPPLPDISGWSGMRRYRFICRIPGCLPFSCICHLLSIVTPVWNHFSLPKAPWWHLHLHILSWAFFSTISRSWSVHLMVVSIGPTSYLPCRNLFMQSPCQLLHKSFPHWHGYTERLTFKQGIFLTPFTQSIKTKPLSLITDKGYITNRIINISYAGIIRFRFNGSEQHAPSQPVSVPRFFYILHLYDSNWVHDVNRGGT
jgi:hypothetical protein